MSDQIETAANLMVRDYLILAFLVSLGSLQIAVSISGIRGLWLLPKPIPTRALGIALIVIGLGYYIFSPMWIEGPWAAGSVIDGTSENRVWGTAALGEISGARNINDIHGGMAGTAYAVYFVASAVVATLFAAIIGAINLRLSRQSDPASNSPSFGRGLDGRENEIPDGLDALANSNAIATLVTSLRNLRKSGRQDIGLEMRSAHRWSISYLIERRGRN